MSTSPRAELLRGRGENEANAHYGATGNPDTEQNAEQTLQQQRAMLSAQDESLQHLSGGVTSVRDIAGQIHTEVESQNKHLDHLALQMHANPAQIARAQQTLQLSARDAYTFRAFCLLLWPTVLLIVLVIGSFLHFLF